MQTITITIDNLRNARPSAAVFAGETVKVRLEGITETQNLALYLISYDNKPLAIAHDFEGGEAELCLATSELRDYLEPLHAGRKAPVSFVVGSTGLRSVYGCGQIAVIQSPMPEDLEALPDEYLNAFIRREDLAGIEELTGSATQKDQRNKINEIINTLQGE